MLLTRRLGREILTMNVPDAAAPIESNRKRLNGETLTQSNTRHLAGVTRTTRGLAGITTTMAGMGGEMIE